VECYPTGRKIIDGYHGKNRRGISNNETFVVCAEENFFFLIRCPPIMLKIFFSHWRLFKKKNNCDLAISGDDWP
jgi:hypothetical protein